LLKIVISTSTPDALVKDFFFSAGGPAVLEPPLELLEPGDAGGGGGSDPELVGMLLAA
jgi:hypothetical protein